MSDLDIFRKVLRDVQNAMTYKSDQAVFRKEEYWRSWSAEVLAGQKGIEDDCDGWALTIAELLIHYGIPKENVALAFCEVNKVGYHLVTKVKSRDNSKWYILDCNVTNPELRDGNAIAWPITEYRWESAMYFNKPSQWVADN